MKNLNCQKFAEKYRTILERHAGFREKMTKNKRDPGTRRLIRQSGDLLAVSVDEIKQLLPGYHERVMMDPKNRDIVDPALARSWFSLLMKRGKVRYQENKLGWGYPREVVGFFEKTAAAFDFSKLNDEAIVFLSRPYFFSQTEEKKFKYRSSHYPFSNGDDAILVHGSEVLAGDETLGAEVSANIEIVGFPDDPAGKSYATVILEVKNTRPTGMDPMAGCPTCGGNGCWDCNFSGGY